MSEQFAYRYRSAATQLTTAAEQMQASELSPSVDTAVNHIFQELISCESSPALGQSVE